MSAIIEAIVGGEIAIRDCDLTREQIYQLEVTLSFDNPDYLDALRRGKTATYIPRHVTAVRRDGEMLMIPRAAHGVVARVLRGCVRWVDQRFPGRPHTFALKAAMREHQIATGAALLRAQQGIANGTTGAGKTGAACVCIVRCGVWTLWLAPTLDLAQQAAGEVERFLGVTAAMSVEGRLELGPVTIATWQTAAKHLEAMRGIFGLVVVDEMHGMLGDTRLALVQRLDAKYRVGLTATLKEEDVRAPLLRWHFGPVIARYEVADGLEGGVLAAPRWRELVTDFRFEYASPDDWQPLLKALFADDDRARLIADDIAHDAQGRLALVLSTQKVSLHVQRGLLQARGVRAELLTGDLTRKARETVLGQARAGELDALLCTQLADEGLDICNADRLYMIAPQKSPTRLLQRIGRVVRVQEGKRQPEIVDVVDRHVGVLAYQARTRRRTFEETWGAAIRRAA